MDDKTKQTNSSTKDDETLDLNSVDTTLFSDENIPADRAVDDIARHESDELLKKEDEKLKSSFVSTPTFWQRAKSGLQDWWGDPKRRSLTLAGVGIGLLILFAIPFTRYGILNTIGIRASATVTVVDAETKLPLKNVKVTIDGNEALTDISGNAQLTKVKLGSRGVTITKLAYADLATKVTIGFGGNDISDFSIQATGARYNFTVSDWLSKLPLQNAEATFGENNAVSDSSGLIILTVPPTEDDRIEITIGAEGYSAKTVEINPQSAQNEDVDLFVSTKHFFVSNRSGTYDVLKANVDGSDIETLVEGTGLEREDIRFSVNPTNTKAALVATRDSVTNAEGYLLSGLYIINLETGTIEKKDESERIDMVGWADGSIVYIKVAAGASGVNPNRHRLMSLNVDTSEVVELAASNYFNDVLVAQNYIFYAPSSAYRENAEAFLFRVKANGSDRQTVIDKEVWTIQQDEYDSILFDVDQVWYKSGISVLYANKQDAAPGKRVSNIYTVNPEGGTAAWVDTRDGKGVLLLRDTQTSEDTTLIQKVGLRQPLRWVSNTHMIFRVVSDEETADYIVNSNGGEPQKITDVADVAGVDRWYYYY